MLTMVYLLIYYALTRFKSPLDVVVVSHYYPQKYRWDELGRGHPEKYYKRP